MARGTTTANGAGIIAAILAASLACGLATPAAAQPAQSTPDALAGLSLEELGDIEVTSVSRKAEPLADAPASIFVITADDIRRTGALTLTDALRLAPNLQVAQVNGGSFAISARGMNGSNTVGPNRLLVMIDGRSVYSPLFSGVFWDVQDVVMDDVERIEVISGPGGTLWGVNAVNGVINVITRTAADRRGTRVVAAAGAQAAGLAIRHGGGFGGDGHYAAYGKWTRRDNTYTAAGIPVDDAGRKAQVGVRFDWATGNDRFDVQANAYRGVEGQPEPGAISISGIALALDDVELSGSNLTARWDRALARGGRLAVQAYLDRTERSVPPTFAESLDIADLQWLHALAPRGRHSLVWGANYRRSRDRVDNSAFVAFLPANLTQQWTSVFGQDDIDLSDALRLTVGARLERNDYTGTEFLPALRLAWNAAPGHLLWGAASRAVRAPSRLDRDTHIPGTPPFLLDGGDAVRSEVADVYELGYRGQPTRRLSLSATAFHADYDHVRSVEIHPSGTRLVFGSLMAGKADGIEAWGRVQVAPRWRLDGGFTALRERLWLKPGSNDVAGPSQTGNDPTHTWQLRSAWDWGRSQSLDVGLRHVARLERNAVPAYTAVDVRYGWQVRPGLEVSVIGRNLAGGHAEYGSALHRSELERSVFVKLAWERR